MKKPHGFVICGKDICVLSKFISCTLFHFFNELHESKIASRTSMSEQLPMETTLSTWKNYDFFPPHSNIFCFSSSFFLFKFSPDVSEI